MVYWTIFREVLLRFKGILYFFKVILSLDQSRKVGDRPIIANLKTVAFLEFLEVLFSGLACWSDWKVGEIHFLVKIRTQKLQNCQNSIFREPLIYYEFSKVCIPLKQLEVSEEYKFLFFWGLITTKLHDFPYLLTAGRIKLGDPSNDFKNTFARDVLEYAYPLRQPEVPKKCLFLFFYRAYMMKIQKFLYHENYISYWIGWHFKITKRFIFLLMFNTIYT